MDNQSFDRDLVTVLLNRVASTGSAITYGNLADLMKKRYGYDVNPHVGFSSALGRVQSTCAELGLPCLSVMVVNQQWKPGSGFIPYYRGIHPEAEGMTDSQIRYKEERGVKACSDWSGIIEHYGISYSDLDYSYSAQGYVEGGRETHERLVNEAKRIPALRAKCLAIRGTTCFVCGFNSGERYGVPGIIEVHHLRPLSDGIERETDPAKDLVPVCPNCHALIHSKDPCYTVEEARALVSGHPIDA